MWRIGSLGTSASVLLCGIAWAGFWLGWRQIAVGARASGSPSWPRLLRVEPEQRGGGRAAESAVVHPTEQRRPMWELKAIARQGARQAHAGRRHGDAARLSWIICRRVAEHPGFTAAAAVALYRDVPGEVETTRLREAAVATGKRVFFPVAVGLELEFHEDVDGQFRLGRWGILEPISGVVLPLESGTMLVVPGLLFDARGVRLGRGGGLYDRALAKYSSAFRIGVAYEAQLTPILPRAAWDVGMDVVVSDRRTIETSERKVTA